MALYLALDGQPHPEITEAQAAKNTVEHTKDLATGWYVLTGFFWHEACSVIAGPFSTQDDAMTCRAALERNEGHHSYYIDQVER